MIIKKQYPIGNHILTYEWDKDESNVAKQPVNNLYIEGIWSIKDVHQCDDLCTGCRVVDDETFVYSTFSCGQYTMKLHGDVVQYVSHYLSK